MKNGERQEKEKGAKKEGKRKKRKKREKRDGIQQTAELDRRDQVTATNSWPSSLRKGEQRSLIR
jgi:hypothetical protein